MSSKENTDRSGHRQKEPWPPFQFRYSKRTSHLPVGRKTSRASRCLHHKCAVKMVLRTLHPNPTQTHNIIIYIAPKIFPMVFGNGQDSVSSVLGRSNPVSLTRHSLWCMAAPAPCGIKFGEFGCAVRHPGSGLALESFEQRCLHKLGSVNARRVSRHQMRPS